MEIKKRISELRKFINETEKLIDELISSINAQEIRLNNKENQILLMKDEVGENIKKIDKIIEDYNANS
tara:strand:+ start:678 stop:881 length:204 start_codon:yes stop_codon:yes gene_type:complete